MSSGRGGTASPALMFCAHAGGGGLRREGRGEGGVEARFLGRSRARRKAPRQRTLRKDDLTSSLVALVAIPRTAYGDLLLRGDVGGLIGPL